LILWVVCRVQVAHYLFHKMKGPPRAALVALALSCSVHSLHLAYRSPRPGLVRHHRRFYLASLGAAPAVAEAASEAPPMKRAGLGSMKLYNTMTRGKEVFEPKAPPYVSMYTCGPTVRLYLLYSRMEANLSSNVAFARRALAASAASDATPPSPPGPPPASRGLIQPP
jgi:hypothetical protein